MHRIVLALAPVVAIVAGPSVAAAQDWSRSSGHGGYQHRQADRQSEIDRRQDRQQHRIERGVRSGEITPSEYHRLQAEQARIRQLEANAKRDGHISRHEAEQIRRAQNDASRHIRHEKHDGDRRGGWWGWRR